MPNLINGKWSKDEGQQLNLVAEIWAIRGDSNDLKNRYGKIHDKAGVEGRFLKELQSNEEIIPSQLADKMKKIDDPKPYRSEQDISNYLRVNKNLFSNFNFSSLSDQQSADSNSQPKKKQKFERKRRSKSNEKKID